MINIYNRKMQKFGNKFGKFQNFKIYFSSMMVKVFHINDLFSLISLFAHMSNTTTY